jgi:DNA ligase-1
MCSGQISRRVKSPLSKCGIIVCLLLAGGLWLAAQTCASELMLPQVYTGQVDVAGWLMSEKLDGVRGYWDGRQLLSKSGNPLHPPAAFIRDLPPFPLEGELWGGRGRFEQTIGSVKRQQSDPGWLQLKFAIFDVPQAPGGFRERMRQASDWFAAHPTNYAFIIPQIPVRDQAHLQQELERIERLGGEGLIVRRPDARYRAGRSMEILKVKSQQARASAPKCWVVRKRWRFAPPSRLAPLPQKNGEPLLRKERGRCPAHTSLSLYPVGDNAS